MVTEGPWLDGLTEAQRAAVVHPATPLLVLAGPGSGKTRVITRRIAHLVAQGAAPWSILALTFTNKASGEMKERVQAMLEAEVASVRGLQVSTFHSFCAMLLRRYGSSPAAAASDGTPLAPGFSIFDADDARDAAKRAIATAGLDSKNWPAAIVLSRISDAKNKLLDAAAYAAEAGDFTSRSLAKIYRAYEAELAKCNAVDFDDLLLRVARLVRQDTSVREELQQRYRHVLIDEYQDTNHAQFVIAGAIAQAHGSLTVVGDPDQSIYAWRGADITNILDFEQHFPGAAVIPLGQNFRSTGHIVAVADGLIRHNARRKHKDLTTELEPGALPQVIRALDERHEARVIVDEMVRQHEAGVPWKGMAALYRMNALSRVIEDELRRRSIPYVVVRGTAFYERREIKDALAYLRTLANPSDEVALRRIINVPGRGIGAATIARADALAAAHGLGFEAALAATDGLTARARKAIDGFLASLAQWRADLMQGAPHEVDDEDLPQMLGGMLGGYVARVLTESGFEAAAGEGSADAEEAAERRANVAELVTAASEFRLPPQEPGAPRPQLVDVLRAFLERVALVTDSDAFDPEAGAVTLMSLHAAKGLEFPFVAVLACEEGILPHSRVQADPAQLEEERRLLFVGITRAERQLMLSSAAMRTLRGIREAQMESQFIEELPGDRLARRDLAGGPRGASTDPDAPAWEPDADERQGWKAGMRVRHRQFGMGQIESVLRQGSVTTLRVAFRTVGVKSLVAEYARLEIVN
ncbi:MAG: ATP-dependent DNA helicase PcrA [Planctomycetes bacterium]|nr:ATP-dependent DNA helicase PcrA [Planctomycetota bacterium]